jgi:basic membrane protein A
VGCNVGAVVVARRPALLLLALLVTSGLCGSPAVAAGTGPRPRVALVTYNCGAGNIVCSAFEAAIRRTGIRGRIISPDPREDPVGTLSFLAAQGYDPVIVDSIHSDGLAVVAARFPRTHFVLFDAPLSSVHVRTKNVRAIVDEPQGAAYLAGWLAARLEQRRPGPDVIGAIGGLPVPAVADFITGFTAGAKHADPRITVLRSYSNDFVDTHKCAALARTQIARGAGVVFDVAGACGLGALAAAKAAGIWGVGVDTDLSGLGPFILTSVIKRYDVAFAMLLRESGRGTPSARGGTTVVGFRQGGATLGRISAKVPASLRVELRSLRAQLLAGQIAVPSAANR